MRSLKVRFEDNSYLGKSTPDEELFKSIAQIIDENKHRTIKAMLICRDFRSQVSWADFP